MDFIRNLFRSNKADSSETKRGQLMTPDGDPIVETFRKILHDQGNIRDLEKWLDKGGDPNTISPGPHKNPLLYDAAYAVNLPVVELLIRKGADPNRQNRDGKTPLLACASHNRLDIIQALVENGADVNLAPHEGWTALHLAQDAPVVEYLLDHGAQVNAPTGLTKITPLENAIEGNNLEKVKLLLAHGGKILGNKPPVFIAVDKKKDTLALVEYLVQEGFSVNEKGFGTAAPLHISVHNRDIAAAEFLLAHGADPNSKDHQGRTPLAIAEAKGYTELVELLSRKTTLKTGRAYLVILYQNNPLSETEKVDMVSGMSGQLGCPVEILAMIHAADGIPAGPDAYVISLCLTACKGKNINFDSNRDKIAYRCGMGLGVAIITMIQD